MPLPVFITPGEPAGIGGEILLHAACQLTTSLLTMDDPYRLKKIAEDLKIPFNIKILKSISQAKDLSNGTLAVLPIKWAEPPQAGTPSLRNAPQIIDAIQTAVRAAQHGQIKAIVTNPIQKSTLYEGGFKYPGHTEFLGALDSARKAYPVMMLMTKEFKAVPLTVHIPLKDVAQSISPQLLSKTAKVLDDALRRDFGHSMPRIHVAGLNPHAGENGNLGIEENQTIAPTIKKLAAEGMNISGPYSADTLFHPERRQNYDAVIAMYHDQALIPIKTVDFYGGVNITLGLSYIRTSPDHGTALSEAGKGTASPRSLIAAIEAAENIYKRRLRHDL